MLRDKKKYLLGIGLIILMLLSVLLPLAVLSLPDENNDINDVFKTKDVKGFSITKTMSDDGVEYIFVFDTENSNIKGGMGGGKLKIQAPKTHDNVDCNTTAEYDIIIENNDTETHNFSITPNIKIKKIVQKTELDNSTNNITTIDEDINIPNNITIDNCTDEEIENNITNCMVEQNITTTDDCPSLISTTKKIVEKVKKIKNIWKIHASKECINTTTNETYNETSEDCITITVPPMSKGKTKIFVEPEEYSSEYRESVVDVQVAVMDLYEQVSINISTKQNVIQPQPNIDEGYHAGTDNYDCDFTNSSINIISANNTSIPLGLGLNFSISNCSDDMIFYRHMTTNVVFCYQVKPNMLKESIILNHSMNITVEYLMSIGDMNWEYENGTGNYRFYTADVEFVLYRGQILDSNNTTRFFDYNITWHGNNTFTLRMDVNTTMLSNLSFPVVIDPTLGIFTDIIILMNPSFETGNTTGWLDTLGFEVISGAAPDGNYYISPDASGFGKFLYSDHVIKNQYFRFWHKGGGINTPHDSRFYIYGFDFGHNFIQKYDVLCSLNWDWVLYEYDLSKNFTMWDDIKYLQIKIDFPLQYTHYFDGFYFGDYHNETNMLTLNPCDTQTIQNQDSDIISTWVTNSYGVPLNYVTISLQNYPLQSVSVNGVKVAPDYGVYYLGGSFGVGVSKYIEIGFSTPSTIGLFNATISFMGNVGGHIVATETFNIQFNNIMIMFTAIPNMNTFLQGETTQITVSNNMDRDIWIRYEIRYDGSLIFQTPENIIFNIGDSTVFSYLLLNAGTYSFDYTIYFMEVEIQRELHLQKTLKVETDTTTYIKQTEYPSTMWEINGNTTLSFPVIINNTGDTDLIIYVAIMHPNGTIVVDKKTVWSGKYTYYYTIQIPTGGYDNTSFNIKTYRLIYETPSYINETINYTKPEFVYGTTINLTDLYGVYGSYLFGIGGLNDTYTVYEGEKTIPYVPGIWEVFEENPYLLPLIIIALIGSIVIIGILTMRKKRTQFGGGG